MKNFPDPPVQCADWSGYISKVEWLSQAISKLQGRKLYWIDDDVRNYAKEIEELKLSMTRYIQVSAKGAEALTETLRSLEELREGLEKLRDEEIVKEFG